MSRRMIRGAAVFTFGIALGWVAASAGPSAQGQPAFPTDGRIALVDLLRIARESTEGRAAAAQIKALSDKKLSDLSERNKQLQARLKQLQDTPGGADTPARADLANEIQQNQADLERARRDAGIEMNDLEQRLLRDFSRRLAPIVRQVAAEKQLHLVLPVRSDFLWAHPGLDVTEQVMSKFNAAK